MTFEPPDEETTSLLWQLSIGKPLTLEEVDKLIMFFVNLKFKAIENFVKQSRKDEASTDGNATSAHVQASGKLKLLAFNAMMGIELISVFVLI